MRTFIFFLLLITLGHSQSEKDSVALYEDVNSTLQERKFEDDLTQKYSGEDFDYTVKTGEASNLLERIIRWLLELLQSIFNWLGLDFEVSPGTIKILTYIIYALMGGLVIYLIVRMFVNERFEAIFTKKAKSFADIELAEQHIEAIDFVDLLNKALKKKDYRLVVRYRFLMLLKKLSQKEFIDWHFEKTNSEYQSEINEPRLKSGFSELAYLYDYVWYGEQPMNEDLFKRAESRFEKMNQIIPD